MKVIRSITDFQAYRSSLSSSVGFVPTMGALHEGHSALLRRSVEENDQTMLSIYVNQTQFNNSEDLAKYPNKQEEDLKVAEDLCVDCVLIPDFKQMYPDNFTYQLEETAFSRRLCGAYRPGHFTGVLTVVMKLFNIVRPRRAYFGEKDYQQFQLIKGMVEAFFLDVDVIACQTVREDDGLAMSSRNLNLSACDRSIAPKLNEGLKRSGSDTDIALWLTEQGFEVDYVVTEKGRRYVAANLGSVRLIDNIAVTREQGEQSA